VPDRDSPPLEIDLFGPPKVQVNGQPLPRLRSRKTLWLLVLLALRDGREVAREWLEATLWPDSEREPAKINLRTSLMDLRRALHTEAHRLRSPTGKTLRLDLAGAEVDVIKFDAGIARGDAASLEEAVALYRGPLLEGCAEGWAFEEREPRKEAYLRALETLAGRAVAERDDEAAERHLRRAVAQDPTRETAQRALMRVLMASGTYGAAIQVYRELRGHLKRELNVLPSRETESLRREILNERARRSKRPHPASRRPRPPSPPQPRSSRRRRWCSCSRTSKAARASWSETRGRCGKPRTITTRSCEKRLSAAAATSSKRSAMDSARPLRGRRTPSTAP
jgi:DNA-binding SARP family transcriptional activator